MRKRESGLLEAMKGGVLWLGLKIVYGMNPDCVVIVCPEKSEAWNACAIRYLPVYQKRKSASRAIAIIPDGYEGSEWSSFPGRIVQMKEREIRSLMRFYCLGRFSDNVAFFYLDFPRDNRNGFILKNSAVSMEELVCLGVYRLREVPEIV